jgi:hypothetical protein
MRTTVRALLFAEGDVAGAMRGAPAWRAAVDGLGAVVPALAGPALRAVENDLSTVLGGLLELDVGQILVTGWCRHRALVRAARVTRESPDTTELVRLATHQVSSTHHPYVEVVVTDATVATLRFEVGVVLELDSLVASVRRGRVVAVQSGHCTAIVSLGCGGRELASRRLALDPAVVVDLGPGVEVVPEPPPGAVAVPPTQRRAAPGR